MKLGSAMIAMFFCALPAFAHAEWITKTVEDNFTNAKKATMIATINAYDADQIFLFDCTKETLSFAYIEKSIDLGKATLPVDMVVKIDAGENLAMKGVTGFRNEEFSQILTDEREPILNMLKEAAQARSKITVDLSIKELDVRQSYSADMAGAAKAIEEFSSACGLNFN